VDDDINSADFCGAQALGDQPESNDREMMIERERKPNPGAFHDHEARRINGG
jgi:hypothetical protein